jgi:uncharacterized integral membrane protein
MKFIVLLVFVVIFVVAVIFSVLNFHLVQINLGFTSISLPLTVALTIELFAGIAIGLAVAFLRIVKLKSGYAQLNKKLKRNESE